MRAAQVVTLLALLSSCAPPMPARFEQMTPKQKHVFMERAVMPEMNRVFAAFDPHRYPKLECRSCHEHGRWQMPNRDLLLEPEALDTKAPDEMQRFMREQVTPAMARLLGRAPRRDDCFLCHARDD